MNIEPFRPITREMACEILAISGGTLDKLVAEGVLPPPVALGSSRRVYWHPDRFHGALNDALTGGSSALQNVEHETRRPTKKQSKPPRNDKLAKLNS